MRWRDLKIGKKLGMSFGLVLILLAAIGIIEYFGLSKIRSATEEYARWGDIQFFKPPGKELIYNGFSASRTTQ